MKRWIKILLISLLAGYGFYIISGSGATSMLLIVLINYFENRFQKFLV